MTSNKEETMNDEQTTETPTDVHQQDQDNDNDVDDDHNDVIPMVEQGPNSSSSSSRIPGLLLGKERPLLAKLSTWSKVANHNAKDFLNRQRWKAPPGGILGNALSSLQPIESAHLEEPSPTKSPKNKEQKEETNQEMGSSVNSKANDDDDDNDQEPKTMVDTTTNSEQPCIINRRRMHSGDSSSQFDEEGSEAGSCNSSNYTDSQEEGSATFKGTIRWAAASVVDSVQTYRGRYNTQNSNNGLATPIPLVKTLSATSGTSQTTRILQSRVKDHLEQLMEGLEHHEYIMLLGHGLLGVNLKATYLQNRGVYVDYLVPHGAAAASQVIQPGDALLRIGETDVQRSNIYKVPAQIASAPRPVHLVLATGLPPKHLYEIGHLDVAVAILHQWQQEQGHQEELSPARSNVQARQNLPEKTSNDDTKKEEDNNDDDDSRGAVANLGTTSSEAKDDEEENNEEQVNEDNGVSLVHPTSFDSCDTAPRPHVADLPTIANALEQNKDKSWFWLPPPNNDLRRTCRDDVARRCSDLRVTTAGVQAEKTTLERALQYALLEVVTDYRKRSFWERHIKALAAEKPNQPPPAALLVLFLELWDFGQYYDFMDANQRSTAMHRIAHTYFIPTMDAQVGLIPPLLDFHSLVGDASLREIESVLKHQTALTRNVWNDCFEAAVGELARYSFLQFLQSDECARMRGHLRHTAPFWNVPLPQVVEELCKQNVEETSPHAQNYAIYLLTYLLCQTDNDGIGELIDRDGSNGRRTRIENAASGFCAALFIKGPWLAAVRSGEIEPILSRYQQLWDIYLSPSVGSLAMTSLSPRASLTLENVLEVLDGVRSHPDAAEPNLILPSLVDDVLVNRIHQLANDLLYDYARNTHPKFMVHKFHEWMCQEAVKLLSDDYPVVDPIPRLPPGSIKRFLRKVEFPSGVSTHKPTRMGSDGGQSKTLLSAECAVVFGNNVGLGIMNSIENEEDTRRYICESVISEDSEHFGELLPENIPPTLEAYASIPLSQKNAMSSYVHEHWVSSDGWEIALLNFVLPRTDTGGDDAEDRSLYGVSLVFQRLLAPMVNWQGDEIPTQLVAGSLADDASPISFESADDSTTRKVVVDGCEVTDYNACLEERMWRDRITREVRSDRTVAKVGVALVSRSNVIVSMREALSSLLRDFSRTPGSDDKPALICGPLIDVLGNFANQDVDSGVLRGLLKSYLKRSTKPWIERPLSVQQDDFEKAAGEQLVASLPPIALAMMFVTALLEQKIVITSKRRSLLLSSTVALKQMLQPLKWCHLMVPRVPTNLAADLLQYPAPFILGFPSDEPGVMELVRNLPEDVTLVDLDVGRVIFAPSFAHSSELGRGSSDDMDTPSALRSQVLFLAQSLGTMFGGSMDALLWNCDRPVPQDSTDIDGETSRFIRLRRACREFVEELLAGTTSCCYWIEESAATTANSPGRSDPTVFFDEDHFYHLKNKRSQNVYVPLLGNNPASGHLALALEEFDLVLELFLRCQAVSMYIGNLDKSSMVYAG